MEINDIKKIGIVGAGTMGHGIALNFALAGYPVILTDVDELQVIIYLIGCNLQEWAVSVLH